MKKRIRLTESELKYIISQSVKRVLSEETENKYDALLALYIKLGDNLKEIKELCEEEYRKSTDEDVKRIIDAVWDDVSDIELLLSDSESRLNGGNVHPSTYKAIETGSNTFHK